MRILLSILTAAILATPSRAQPLITNAAELASLADAEMAAGRRFRLQGTILTGYPHLFRTADATILLHGGIEKEHLMPGDVVGVIGETQYNSARINYVTTTRKLSAVPPPEPEPTDPLLLAEGRADLRFVSVCGHVDAIFVDEIDPRYVFLILDCGRTRLLATVLARRLAPPDMARLEGADVQMAGAMVPLAFEPNLRHHLGRIFKTWGSYPIRILRPADNDPDAVPELSTAPDAAAQDVVRLGRRRIAGIVLAAWGNSSLLLQDASNRLHRVELSNGQPRPNPGDRVTTAGTVETDLYNLNLSHAICRIDEPACRAPDRPADMTNPADMLSDELGNRQFNPRFCGTTVRLRGTVRDSAVAQDPDRLELDCGQHIVPVALGGTTDPSARPSAGCRIEVVGTCVLDVDNWLPSAPFPRIRSITVVTRSARDLRVLSKPPWWTPARFALALCSALAVLLGFLVWNQMLRRLVERRSRELTDEQVAHAKSEFRTLERTNLAIELHDTLSQDLAAVACQIAATASQFHDNPSEALKNLATSETMLLSCRTELKRCLWDLRNETLEDADMTHALCRTLQALAKDVRLTVRFNVPRDCLTDSGAHAVLCIVRELVSNAVMHGRASSIKIAGSLEGGLVRFSVQDDGSGFDTLHRPGPDTGHFGLAGIEARIKRLHGKMSLRSSPGKGTRIAVTISIAEPEDR